MHGRAHYRCRFPRECALANDVQHPLAVYLREDRVMGPLDEWLADVFAPDRVEQTLDDLTRVRPVSADRREPLVAALAEADRKLVRHRAALEAGVDPQLVGEWIRQVQAERHCLHAALTEQHPPRPQVAPLSREEIRALVDGLGGMLAVLRTARPQDKAEVYRQLGLTSTFQQHKRRVSADIQPTHAVGVRFVSEGGLEPPPPCED